LDTGSFPRRLNSVVLTEFSSYLAFCVDTIKPNGRKTSSNEYCRALSTTSDIQNSSLEKIISEGKIVPQFVTSVANFRALSSKNSKMPKLHHGVGANCTVLTKFIHPSEHIRKKHANLDKGHQTLVIIASEETCKVRRKEQKCYTFRSDDYPNTILYAVKRYVNVVTEGPPETFFNQPTGDEANDPRAAAVEVPNMPPHTNDHNEDIQAGLYCIGCNCG
jgi:hypothetical protein